MCLICGNNDGLPACRRCKCITVGVKVVGEVDPLSREYYSRRIWDKHYFQTREGWGLSASVIRTLISEKYRRWVEWVVLGTDKGIYRASVADFLKHGEVYFDGKDKQYVLHLSRFNKTLINVDIKH